MITPETWPVDSVPSAQPLLSHGTCDATSAMALGMYPEVSPISARSSISLRPRLSAMLPHRGDTMADTKKVALNTMPDQRLSDS